MNSVIGISSEGGSCYTCSDLNRCHHLGMLAQCCQIFAFFFYEAKNPDFYIKFSNF